MQNVKAYLRRGTARETLICYKEALQGENPNFTPIVLNVEMSNEWSGWSIYT